MSAIIDIGPIQPTPYPTRAASDTPCQRQPLIRTQDGDTVELSGVGRTLSESVAQSRYRTAWLRSIRAEIDGGAYETRERINGTVDRLLDVLA